MAYSFNFNFKIFIFCNFTKFSSWQVFMYREHQLFLWSLMVISGILASIFLSVSFAISHRIVALSVSATGCGLIPVFFVGCTLVLVDLPLYVLTNSVMSVFVFSGMYYMISRWEMIYCLIVLVTHSGRELSIIFYDSCLTNLGEEALVLCSHDESFCFSFHTHNAWSLMSVCLINVSLLTPYGLSTM